MPVATLIGFWGTVSAMIGRSSPGLADLLRRLPGR